VAGFVGWTGAVGAALKPQLSFILLGKHCYRIHLRIEEMHGTGDQTTDQRHDPAGSIWPSTNSTTSMQVIGSVGKSRDERPAKSKGSRVYLMGSMTRSVPTLAYR
jgi:hypothetical protein